MVKLERQIKNLGLKSGFDLVGITSAEKFVRDEQVSIARVKSGLMDGLSWYTEDRVKKANDPGMLLEDARSIISLAVSYNTRENKNKNKITGKIARYAWGEDYHDVIKQRLRCFVEELKLLAGEDVKTRIFVDDGPMNDRAAAERAGVGWFGKNTNILTQNFGSWVFLSQVITDIELAPDLPLNKTCGSCVICIEQCPTGAIVAPYVIDNTKCISFLTIELRDSIPRDLRHLMGDWIFGCDICQDVCPVNRKAVISLDPKFTKLHEFSAMDLIPLLDLSQLEFNKIFKDSAIKRAKLSGFQRNVCVALGNIGDPVAVPALRKVIQTDYPDLVRSHAAWALGRIGGKSAMEILNSHANSEKSPEVLEEIQEAICSGAS
ncbi:MAG: epoxyqueuosine reductase [Chloroflexota bacterium]|jgi:epoxyqueuosine reductase|nr:tRNA epoxyqueuosine(34) reductase QueG [Chloroflexota bacterium]GIS69168.1 MAG: epoxyqueuosine reductase [Chloroflexota bacterium]|tara:strand:- start:1355 stop:2485 length:1131 start_codon:yes stop_codon:yes gene_type:complete